MICGTSLFNVVNNTRKLTQISSLPEILCESLLHEAVRGTPLCPLHKARFHPKGLEESRANLVLAIIILPINMVPWITESLNYVMNYWLKTKKECLHYMSFFHFFRPPKMNVHVFVSHVFLCWSFIGQTKPRCFPPLINRWVRLQLL